MTSSESTLEASTTRKAIARDAAVKYAIAAHSLESTDRAARGKREIRRAMMAGAGRGVKALKRKSARHRLIVLIFEKRRRGKMVD